MRKRKGQQVLTRRPCNSWQSRIFSEGFFASTRRGFSAARRCTVAGRMGKLNFADEVGLHSFALCTLTFTLSGSHRPGRLSLVGWVKCFFFTHAEVLPSVFKIRKNPRKSVSNYLYKILPTKSASTVLHFAL